MLNFKLLIFFPINKLRNERVVNDVIKSLSTFTYRREGLYLKNK